MEKHNMSNDNNKVSKVPVFWSTILLGLIVAAVFLAAIISFQVQENERALVITMGKITAEKGPGLHLRLPPPVQEIVRYDIRQRCFNGIAGSQEEIMTSDAKNVVVGIYTIYKIDDLKKFKNAAKNINAAEEYLGIRMQSAKGAVIGKYKFDQMINTDPKKMKLTEIEKEMFDMIAPDVMERYGLKVYKVGIRTINVPDKITSAIVQSMKEERKTAAARDRERGKTEAEKIKTDANTKKRAAITNAEAEAKRIMAEGDAKAAEYLKVFSENPELAAFIRKMESLKRILGTKTTLVLDTNTTPFDFFKLQLGSLKETSKVPAGKSGK